MVMVYKAPEDEIMVLDNQFPDVKPASQHPDLIVVYIFRNDGTVIVIKNEGDAKRSLKGTFENMSLQKWLTAKERYKKDTESYIPFNRGKPLAPDWFKGSN